MSIQMPTMTLTRLWWPKIKSMLNQWFKFIWLIYIVIFTTITIWIILNQSLNIIFIKVFFKNNPNRWLFQIIVVSLDCFKLWNKSSISKLHNVCKEVSNVIGYYYIKIINFFLHLIYWLINLIYRIFQNNFKVCLWSPWCPCIMIVVDFFNKFSIFIINIFITYSWKLFYFFIWHN